MVAGEEKPSCLRENRTLAWVMLSMVCTLLVVVAFTGRVDGVARQLGWAMPLGFASLLICLLGCCCGPGPVAGAVAGAGAGPEPEPEPKHTNGRAFAETLVLVAVAVFLLLTSILLAFVVPDNKWAWFIVGTLWLFTAVPVCAFYWETSWTAGLQGWMQKKRKQKEAKKAEAAGYTVIGGLGEGRRQDRRQRRGQGQGQEEEEEEERERAADVQVRAAAELPPFSNLSL